MKWLDRRDLETEVSRQLRAYPVVLLLGPRQCGKTSLARRIRLGGKATYFDLEDPGTPLHAEAARVVLKDLTGLVVIDEFQRQPGLFELLRVLADRRPLPARFLILGSASPDLVRGVSETLAGRVAYVDMAGFSLEEAGASHWRRLWVRGGLPPAFLAANDEASHEWRLNFIRSFLERDIPQLGIRVPSAALRRFWTMVAHVHGEIWNASDLGRAMDVKPDSARRYLDILAGSFMVRQLPPWFANVGKRLVKSPKVYLRDTGVLHALLGLRNQEQVLSHPKLGASWEGFAIEEVIRNARAERDAFYYRTHAGAELDLLLQRGGRSYGFEVKFGDSPRITSSMRVAMEDLRLTRLWVVYPGDSTFPLDDRIEALPLAQLRRAVSAMNAETAPRGH